MSKELTERIKTSKDLLEVEHKSVSDIFVIKESKTPQTFRPPPSSVLSRVRDFLPLIDNANNAMKEQLKKDPSKLDIETIEDTEGPVIEMNIAPYPIIDNSDSDSSSDDTDSDSDDLEIEFGPVTEKNFITRKSDVKKSSPPVIKEIDDDIVTNKT